MFDAVSVALDQLELANIAAGSVVVLSDGADTGSRVSPAAVKKRARTANVAVHTVGLRSRAFDDGGLRGLAAATGGQFAATQSAQELRRVFRALGAQLASDYLLRYRSNAQPGREVTVAVRIDGLGGLGTRTYQVPGDATFVQFKDSFWGSNLGTALTALLSALLLAMALAILLARRLRGPTLRERIANFATPDSENPIDPGVELTGRPRGGAERSLDRTAWWPAFKLDVEIARIDVAAMRIMTGTVLATLVFMFLLVQVTGIVLVGLFALAVPWGVRTWVRVRRDRQRALFTDQLPDLLQGAAQPSVRVTGSSPPSRWSPKTHRSRPARSFGESSPMRRSVSRSRTPCVSCRRA